MIKEFKSFAVKGNVIDLAVGVVIGGAFGRIVTSLVNDIIMPIIGLLSGGINYADLKLILKETADPLSAVTLNYGQFIQNIIDFFIISFSIFVFIKLIDKLSKKQEMESVSAKKSSPTRQEELLIEIRDLLKNTNHK